MEFIHNLKKQKDFYVSNFIEFLPIREHNYHHLDHHDLLV